MLFRVGIAVFLSFILIGGATWVRVSNQKSPAPTLIGVESSNTEGTLTYEDVYGPAKDAETAIPEENLTTTDLIGRQLISEYISLSSKSELSPDSLMGLADKYIELVPSIKIAGIKTISVSDIETVSDTEENYLDYDENINVIYEEYIDSFDLVGEEELALNELPLDHVSSIQKIYKNISQNLSDIAVPKSIASSHIKLINHYLSVENYLQKIIDESSDPVVAMANLIILSEKSQDEAMLIDDINDALSLYVN